MGGFGGALKNMSIGLASSYGKIWIHSSGTSTRFEDVFTADHDSFLESMADADRSVMDYMGRENICLLYTSSSGLNINPGQRTGQTRLVCIGDITAGELKKHGIKADITAGTYHIQGRVQAIADDAISQMCIRDRL